MRISDWSSDVCSSDLIRLRKHREQPVGRRLHRGIGLGSLPQAPPQAAPAIMGERQKLILRQPDQRRHQQCRKRQIIARLKREADERKHRSEEHTSELQSLMRISYAVFCLKKKNTKI